jgi:hypothetical protein
VNAYNLGIARKRARIFIEHTIDLLTSHTISLQYPGIVFALGGDMFSSGIHEELMATDEREIMPIFVDVFEVLVWCIKMLVDHISAFSSRASQTTTEEQRTRSALRAQLH